MALIPVFGSEDQVPSSVAGLNLLEVLRYEDPRLGVEFRYGFPPICKADAYLYDSGLTGISGDLRSQPVAEAFKQSYEEVLQAAKLGATRDLEVLETSILTLPGEPSTPFCYYAGFAYGQNEQGPFVPKGIEMPADERVYVSTDVGRVRSHLAVRADRGFINKVRFTYVERATEPSYIGANPEELPERLRNDVAFNGFWHFLLAWQHAVQSAPMPIGSQQAGVSPTPTPRFAAPNPPPAGASTDAQHPSSATAAPAPADSVTPPPSDNVCQVCQRSPAAPLKLVQQTGTIFNRRSGAMDAVLCQSCGMALFRQAQSHNLARGWWGIIAFFSNFFSLAGNASRAMKHRLIGPPTGTPLAPALDPGRPIWLRWQMIVPAVLTALAVLGIISAAGRQNVGALQAGQCINIPTAGNFTDVALVPCEEPHDAEVAGVLPASTSSGTDVEKACVDVAVDNVLLSRARDVAPSTLVRTGTSKSSGSDTPRAVCILVDPSGAKLTGRVTGGDGTR